MSPLFRGFASLALRRCSIRYFWSFSELASRYTIFGSFGGFDVLASRYPNTFFGIRGISDLYGTSVAVKQYTPWVYAIVAPRYTNTLPVDSRYYRRGTTIRFSEIRGIFGQERPMRTYLVTGQLPGMGTEIALRAPKMGVSRASGPFFFPRSRSKCNYSIPINLADIRHKWANFGPFPQKIGAIFLASAPQNMFCSSGMEIFAWVRFRTGIRSSVNNLPPILH